MDATEEPVASGVGGTAAEPGREGALAAKPAEDVDTRQPATLTVRYQDHYGRLLALVRVVLLVPHYIVLVPVYAVNFLVWLGSLVSVLRTGVYPAWLFEFMTGVGRWTGRVVAYELHLTDRYPPFSLQETPDDDVRLRVEYPRTGIIDRWRPLVSWLLVIPHLVMLVVLVLAMILSQTAAGLCILATGRHPRALFDFSLRVINFGCWVLSYGYFLTERYPPFRLPDAPGENAAAPSRPS